jgi:RsiW-degrading membrane proteinase PrsW (M82 family)
VTISASCTHCGTTFQLADAMAGKQARCSRCKEIFSIPVAGLFARPTAPAPTKASTPAPPPAPPRSPPPSNSAWESASQLVPVNPPTSPTTFDDDEFRLAPAEPVVNTARLFAPPPPPSAPTPSSYSASSNSSITKSSAVDWKPPATRGRWRDHTHWVLLLALIPLIIDTVVEVATRGKESDVTKQIEYDEYGEEIGVRFSSTNAFLSRESKLHWVFAIISAGVFATALALFNDDRKLQTWMLLGIGLATGTAGIFLLLAFQFLAFFMPFRFGRGLLGIILLIVALIGLSYRCALDPGIGFIPSFFGFVFGVGLCEELVKAIPIVIYLKNVEHTRWRVAMLVGLASGIGFGVSEGISYSGEMYNGYAGPSIYLVRFVSCVALHSIWAGSVGLLMHMDQETLFEDFDFVTAGTFVVKYLSIAMVLHGLYDVLLKQELPWAALLVALASFGWLAFLVHRSEGTEWSTAIRSA